MKNVNIFSVFFAVSMLFVFAAPAGAVDLNEATCNDLIGGAWLDNTCTPYMDFIIEAGEPIVIPIGTILQINNTKLTNYRNITVVGTFVISGGMLANMESGNIHITPGGFLKNFATIYNVGTIFIECGGTYTSVTTSNFIGNPIIYGSCLVTVIVTDYKTGKPISNAQVSIDNTITLTNVNGIAIVEVDRIGRHTYEVTKRKFQIEIGTFNINDLGYPPNFMVFLRKKPEPI